VSASGASRRLLDRLQRRGFFGGLGGFSVLAAAPAAAQSIAEPAQLLEDQLRVTGDISGAQSMGYGKVVAYAFIPGQRGFPLFGLEIYGASRTSRTAQGWERLHKEVGYYTDLASGQILERWRNPMLDKEVEVIPIMNDPVNRRSAVDPSKPGGGLSFRANRMAGHLLLTREVFLRYPNPLTRADWPNNSAGDFYEATEMFNDFARLDDLADRSRPSVPSVGTWTRIGPWLPWMEMGNRPGWLVYHGHGVKLMNGVADLPKLVRDYAEKHHAEWLTAPTRWSEPNETSWTYFKKVMEKRKAGGV
jgi:hypothetical protein